MNPATQKRAIWLCDEGMILAQGILDRTQDSTEYKAAQQLFDSFYSLKMMYKGAKTEPNTF